MNSAIICINPTLRSEITKAKLSEYVLDCALVFPNLMNDIDQNLLAYKQSMDKYKKSFNDDPLQTLYWRTDDIIKTGYCIRELNYYKKSVVVKSKDYPSFITNHIEYVQDRKNRLTIYNFSQSVSPVDNYMSIKEYEVLRDFYGHQNWGTIFSDINIFIEQYDEMIEQDKVINWTGGIFNPYFQEEG